MISINKIINRIPLDKKASFVAGLAGSAVYNSGVKINNKIYRNIQQVFLQEEKQGELVKKIAKRVIKTRHLDNKGVKIKVVDKIPAQNLSKNLVKSLEEYKAGKNAALLVEPIVLNDGTVYANKNTILMGKNPNLLLLHELGHADSYNNSKIFKHFIDSRKIEPRVVNIARNCAVQYKNTDSKTYKAFLHKNSTLIGILSQIPTLVDEGVASCKAIRWIRQFSGNEKLAKQAQKELGGAYLTYLTASLSKVAEIQTSKVAKDKFLQKFQAKI